MTTPFIKIIDSNEAKGRLKQVYEDLINKRGKLADIHKIHSLNPESLVRHMDLYMTLMFGESPLGRAQREMIAVVVSTVNHCEYCIQHHTEALLNY
ncbi:MAG: carboxymuconolactone decarboxylase family protein [Balneolaceae bacterium]